MSQSHRDPDRQGPKTPHWVKAFGIAGLILLLLVALLLLTGHGPRRHLPGASGGPALSAQAGVPRT